MRRALDRSNLVSDEAKRKFDEIGKKAAELGRLNPTIKVDIETQAAKLKLDLFRADVKRALNDISNGGGSGGSNSWWSKIIGTRGTPGTGGNAGTAGTGLLGILGGVGSIATSTPAMWGLLIAGAAAAAVALAPVAAALIPITAGFGALAFVAKNDLGPVFTALGENGKKLQKTLSTMSESQKDLYKSALPLKGEWDQMAKAVRPEVYKAFATGLKIIKDLMPALKPLLIAAGKAVDQFLNKLLNWLNSPQGQSFINWLRTVGPKDIKNFGRVMWDTAHTVGDALHAIYSAGSWIDKFVTHWRDDWTVVKNVFRLIGDQIVIFALETVQGILTPFTHIPFIGHYFADARNAVHGELVRMQADARNASAQIQASFDSIHGKTVPLNVDLNLPSGIALGSGGQKTQKRAAGGMITGGIPGRDSVLGMLMPGELVVPTHLVQAGAVDHLRGHLPGFAGGGMVGDVFRPPVGVFDSRLVATAYADENAIAAYVAAHASLTAGLRARLTARSGGGGTGGPSPLPGGGNPLANALLAQRMYPPWASGSAWAAWNSVAMRESGWSQFADNASSGAYGIPQALPYTKMPKAAWPSWAGGSSDPGSQISWMVGYIKGRYGSPQNAWAHELSAGSYDHGGFLPTGVSIAVNGTGRPEPVGAAAGNTYNISINVPVSANKAEVGREVVTAIREFEKRSGSSWRR